jgi:hypothetical protein
MKGLDTMSEVRLAGCDGCIGSDRPGYIVAWTEEGGEMKPKWLRCPKKCTPESRAEVISRQQRLRADAAESAAPAPSQQSAPQPVTHPASPRPASAHAGRRPTRPRPPSRPAPATAATPRRWPAVALDDGETGWSLDIPQIPAPAGKKLTDWFAWLGTGLPLRVDRVHDAGRGSDGLVCLSATALKTLGLPAALPSTDKTAAALKKKLTAAAASAGMEISQEIGPIFHVFRRSGSPGGPKTSARVVVTPWLGQGTEKQQTTSEMMAQLARTPSGELDARTLARRIRTYVADLGVAPGVTPATTSKLLLEAVRPRAEWYQDDDGTWKDDRLRQGALPSGDVCVPPAAGARHPLTRALRDRNEAVCEEEDYHHWSRELTAAEAAMPYAVACDVCASYLSVTQSLPLPVGPLEHDPDPTWDSKKAGLWWCDFTEIEVDPLLPHPATFHGLAPTGPGWYATPTVDYMVRDYGFDPSTITDAYISVLTLPALKEWTVRLREAYKRLYSILGLPDGQDPDEYLAAYAAHKQIDEGDTEAHDALVLVGLYKAIYKGGIGKWADSALHMDDEAWLAKVVANWAYRPDIRFHIVAAARIANHRRMRKTYKKTGQAPFAVNRDSFLFAVKEPSPLELLTPPENGKPVLGVLRLGIGPGQFKHESTIPMAAIQAAIENDEHPSRLTHHYDTAGRPLTDTGHDTDVSNDQAEETV